MSTSIGNFNDREYAGDKLKYYGDYTPARRVKEEESDKVNPTPSQIRMMQQIANGVQVKNLAAYKNYQVSKNRLSNLYEKIGATNMAHAVAILMRQGKIK